MSRSCRATQPPLPDDNPLQEGGLFLPKPAPTEMERQGDPDDDSQPTADFLRDHVGFLQRLRNWPFRGRVGRVAGGVAHFPLLLGRSRAGNDDVREAGTPLTGMFSN